MAPLKTEPFFVFCDSAGPTLTFRSEWFERLKALYHNAGPIARINRIDGRTLAYRELSALCVEPGACRIYGERVRTCLHVAEAAMTEGTGRIPRIACCLL